MNDLNICRCGWFGVLVRPWALHVAGAQAWKAARVFGGARGIAVGGFLRVRTRGQCAPRIDAPLLSVAPHFTFYDSLVIALLGGVSLVAKAETRHIPLCGSTVLFTTLHQLPPHCCSKPSFCMLRCQIDVNYKVVMNIFYSIRKLNSDHFKSSIKIRLLALNLFYKC